MILQAVIFDLDGTLLDTLGDLADAVNQALEADGLPVLPEARYRWLVGSGIRRLCRLAAVEAAGGRIDDERSVAAFPVERVDRLLCHFTDIYQKNWQRRTKPYPGVDRLLEGLHAQGIPLAVLSNKRDDFVQEIAAHFFRPELFRTVAGQKTDWPAKPDPASTLAICRQLGASPCQTVLVGDSDLDMLTAVAAGCLPMGAVWGFRGADELRRSGAERLVLSPEDCHNQLLELVKE